MLVIATILLSTHNIGLEVKIRILESTKLPLSRSLTGDIGYIQSIPESKSGTGDLPWKRNAQLLNYYQK